jgi:hypothetical protein
MEGTTLSLARKGILPPEKKSPVHSANLQELMMSETSNSAFDQSRSHGFILLGKARS